MKVEEIGRYALHISEDDFRVLCPMGTDKFSGLATSRLPKIYVASVNNVPIYVGVTKQPIRNRLRYGWSATGEHGYHGYRWRNVFDQVQLDIWCHLDPTIEGACMDVETVEAEIVYLIRASGQWPEYQTEIHFHSSSDEHRMVARQIASKYGIAG